MISFVLVIEVGLQHYVVNNTKYLRKKKCGNNLVTNRSATICIINVSGRACFVKQEIIPGLQQVVLG